MKPNPPNVILALTSLFFSGVLGGSLSSVCSSGGTIVSESYIGEHKNVKVNRISCAGLNHIQAEALAIEARQATTVPTSAPPITTNSVCGDECTPNCFTPSGGGPDPSDCHAIADALRFEDQSTANNFFAIGTDTFNPIVMTYNTCESFFVNQATTDLTYCLTDWAAVIDMVTPSCLATQNADGGTCVTTDQVRKWFVQVQHS